jgi:hypothetical protein
MFEEKYSDELVYDIAEDKQMGMKVPELAQKYNLTEGQIEYIVYVRLRKENEERGLPKDAVVDSKPEDLSVEATVTVGGVGVEVPAPPTNWLKRLWRFWVG